MNDELKDNPEAEQGADERETVPIQEEPSTEGFDPAEATAEELEELHRKATDYDSLMDRFKRATAEFMNSQKRIERQAEDRAAYAVEAFAEELLPVADNLARAIDAAEAQGAQDALLQGVKLVEEQMLKVFRNHGIEMISTKIGDPFNAELQHAVAVIPTDKMPPNKVAEVHHHGFTLRGRLLRPASVTVSAAPQTEE